MDVFHALADPLRRDLLLALRSGSARVVDLAAQHPVSRPAISRHLRQLTEAGLADVTDVGRERHYRLRPAGLTDVQDLLDSLRQVAAPLTAHHLDALDTEVRRTSRERRRATSRAHEETA